MFLNKPTAVLILCLAHQQESRVARSAADAGGGHGNRVGRQTELMMSPVCNQGTSEARR